MWVGEDCGGNPAGAGHAGGTRPRSLATEVARGSALPALGSAEAKRTGTVCIGGQAFRRLANGWEQLASPSGGWLRCRER